MTLTVSRERDVLHNQTIRAFLFDKDGTLIDYLSRWLPRVRRALAALRSQMAGFPPELEKGMGLTIEGELIPEGVVASASIPGTVQVFSSILTESGLPNGQVEAAASWLQRYISRGPEGPFETFADLPVLFDRIHQAGMLVGVVTNGYHQTACQHFSDLGVLDRIDFLQGIEDGVPAKPDPFSILRFCDRFGVSPRELVFVGDTLVDMQAAQNAGVGLKVAVLSGAGDLSTLYPAADVVLASVAEIPALLDTMVDEQITLGGPMF